MSALAEPDQDEPMEVERINEGYKRWVLDPTSECRDADEKTPGKKNSTE